MNRNHVTAKKLQNDRSAAGTTRKLTLHHETLRRLTNDELRLAAGGLLDGGISDGNNFCKTSFPGI